MKKIYIQSKFTQVSANGEGSNPTYRALFVPLDVDSLNDYQYESTAFDNWLANNPKPVPIYSGHEETARVGRVMMDSIEITKRGMEGNFELYDSPNAQNILPAMRDGTVNSVSIGASITDYSTVDGNLVFHEAQLRELSIVQDPAFPDAILQASEKKELEKVLRACGYSKSHALAIIANYNVKEFRQTSDIIKHLSESDVGSKDVSDSESFTKDDILKGIRDTLHEISKGT